MKRDDYTDGRDAVVVALVLWAGAVAAGTQAGVFARLPAEVIAALALFACAFAVATVTVDARVRAWLAAREVATTWAALLGIDVVVVAAGRAFAGGEFAASPWTPLLLFGAPVTIAAGVAALHGFAGAAGRPLRSPASKAPARRPAAT